MFLDALLLVSDAQAFTTTAASTNTIDLSNPTVLRQVGTGERIGFGISVDVAAGSGTTVTFQAITSASADLSTPTVIATIALLAAALIAGKKVFLPIPPGFPLQRYLGLQVGCSGGTATITVTACLMPASMFSLEPVSYAKGYVS